VLKVDQDCVPERDWLQDYIRLVIMVCRWYQVKVLSIKTCLSRLKGVHYYIAVSPAVDALLANKLQYLVGDDAQRVSYNKARIASKLVEWSKLFEKPDCKLRTIYRSNESSLPHRHHTQRLRGFGL